MLLLWLYVCVCLCALSCSCSFVLNIGYYLNQLKVNFTLSMSPFCRSLIVFVVQKKLRCAASRRLWTDVCAWVCVGGGFVCLPGRWTSGEAAASAAVTLSSFGWRWRWRQLLFMALLLLLILLHATALNNCYFAIAIAIYICYLLLWYCLVSPFPLTLFCFSVLAHEARRFFFLFALNKIWTLIKIWSHSPTRIYTTLF